MVDKERYEIYDRQVADSIRSLFELTSRIDERVKLLSEVVGKTDSKFDAIMKNQQELLQRVTALESKNGTETKKDVSQLSEKMQRIELKMQNIETLAKGSQNRWEKIIDYSMKILLAVAATFIVYKLGISNINVTGGP